MSQKIERDVARFKKIVRGKIKDELRKYLTHGEMIGKKGKDLVSIPMPQLDIPHFRYGKNGNGGVSSGQGDVGQPVSTDDDETGNGAAGNAPGGHILEVDVPLEELADILAEELELPDIKPRGESNIVHEKDRYTGVSSTGPESLRHFRRTYKQALKRQIASNSYVPESPVVIPIKEDQRYRTWKTITQPEAKAVVIAMMDVSGSMGDEQKEIVRIETFWIDAWLRSQYKGIENRYIIHDADAKEVDHHTFFHTRESGGTMISAAYRCCADLIDAEFPISEWNIYVLHFSDGDNWGDDDDRCVEILQDRLLPVVNLFGYAQVTSAYGSGRFIETMRLLAGDHENLVLSEISDRDGIFDSMKQLLGKGR